ncbi:MAG: hypothetical protein PHX78_02515 [bacterium]|nr:hypothetical protein [bacterium]
MKYLYPVIFILLLSGLTSAEEVSSDTSRLPAAVEVISQESTKVEVKKEEAASVVQEDYSLVPSIVSDSFQLYREQGAEAFVKSILKGSPLEGDESSAKELERLRNVERYYGKILRHSFVSVMKVTSFYKKIYIILQFAKGPVFCGIDCYYTSQNVWIVSAFTFNTSIEKVFPDVLLKQYLENIK